MNNTFENNINNGSNLELDNTPHQERVNPEMLEIVKKITDAQNFIKSLKNMEGGDAGTVARRAKDINTAMLELNELQEKKMKLLDARYSVQKTWEGALTGVSKEEKAMRRNDDDLDPFSKAVEGAERSNVLKRIDDYRDGQQKRAA